MHKTIINWNQLVLSSNLNSPIGLANWKLICDHTPAKILSCHAMTTKWGLPPRTKELNPSTEARRNSLERASN